MVGALKIPAAGTKMTGISKLAKNEMVENCRDTVALAAAREPLPKEDLHKIAESAIQIEISQLDP